MDFKRMLRAWGVTGPSVETVLASPNCRPGGYLEGTVQLTGGEAATDIEYVAVALTTKLEITGGDDRFTTDQEFHRQRLTGSFKLDAGVHSELEFRFDVPWETPITEVYGQRLHGMRMGLATEVEVARSVAKSDLDAVAVHPLPAQERILDGLLRLGFRFQRADVTGGRLGGVDEVLPFHQRIEFAAPSAYGGLLSRLDVSFVPAVERLQVVFESDKRGGTKGRFDVDHRNAERLDWPAQLDQWLRR